MTTTPITRDQAAQVLQALVDRARADLDALKSPTGWPWLAVSRESYIIAERCRAQGAIVHMTTAPPRMTWAGVTVTHPDGGLALFDAWLAKARTLAGAA